MDNDSIIRRLPHVRFEMTGKLDEIETMTEELASVPPGHERSNQIKQQMHSKVGEVRRGLDELQPDTQASEPVTADVEGSGNHPQTGNGSIAGAIPANGPEQHNGAGNLAGAAPDDPHDGYGAGSGIGDNPTPHAHEVVEMEKKINGEWLAVTVWATSAEHLEADGWSKVGDPRPVEDGEKPVEAEADETDHSNGTD